MGWGYRLIEVGGVLTAIASAVQIGSPGVAALRRSPARYGGVLGPEPDRSRTGAMTLRATPLEPFVFGRGTAADR